MKNQNWSKTLQLSLLFGMAIALIVILSSCGATKSAVQYHKGLQKEYSYENWRKNQPKKRLDAVNAAVKQSKEMKGNNSAKAKLVRKEDRIRKRIIK